MRSIEDVHLALLTRLAFTVTVKWQILDVEGLMCSLSTGANGQSQWNILLSETLQPNYAYDIPNYK